jgi:hypothetical protein
VAISERAVLKHDMRMVPCPKVETLLWDDDELVDVTTGLRVLKDGTASQRTTSAGYPFDRATGLRHRDVFWSVAYTNRQTKALLFKDGKVHRELNRSFYFAHAYDYPIALAVGPSGSAIVIHCPSSFDTLEVEDAETGVKLAARKTPDMEFHSRLAVSGDSRYLLDAGWFWHPLGGAWLCELPRLLTQAEASPAGISFSFGAEIDSAAFLGSGHVVVSSAGEVINDTVPPSGLGPRKLGVWSIEKAEWRSIVDLARPSGGLMPWRDWVIAFYECPTAIEIDSGQIVHQWDQIYSGKQIGSIDLGDPPPPPMAFDSQFGRFAVQCPEGIAVVTLSAQ